MGKTLLRGFLGVAPLAITIILVIWLFDKLEYIFGTPLRYFLGKYYFPGLGIIAALVILYSVGLLLNHWLVKRLYNWMENLLKKTPLLKTIYSAVTDFMSFFRASGKNQNQGKIVMVKINETVNMIGLLTRDEFQDFPESFAKDDKVAVFFPFSYQIGGFTALIPRSKITLIDCSIEQGIRFCATAGSPSATSSI